MSLSLECTVCKEADLSEVASGALECGHIYCSNCIYKLWHTETAAAAERREARVYQARLHALTRTQIQTHANEDAADNGRRLRCPSCQQCSSVDSVRRVFLSSSQAPSTAPATSQQTLSRSTSASNGSAEEVEHLSAQLAIALEHLDAAHARAAESARTHDLHVQQMQAQLMAHAEQAHQSQVQGLAETNAQLQRELSNAQAQLNQAAREANEIKVQFDRAVRGLSAGREKRRIEKARVSDIKVKGRDAATDRLADRLSANGIIGAPLRGGTQTAETRFQTRSMVASAASAALSDDTKSSNNYIERDNTKSPLANIKSSISVPGVPTMSTRIRNPAPDPANPQSASVSSGTRSRRSETSARELSRTPAHSENKIEETYKLENKADKPASGRSNIRREEVKPKYQARGTSSTASRLQPQKKGNVDAAPPPASNSLRNTTATSHVDFRDPDAQHSLRTKALAEGRRWPLSEKIIVPQCSTGTDFKHNFKGKGSNQTYLKHNCEVCGWGCEERTPDGYVPERQRHTTKKKKN